MWERRGPPGAPAAPRLTSEELGFAAGTRALIINADDFGMDGGVNGAVIEAIERGVVSSCSVLTVAEGTSEALTWLAEHPEVPFGVHLTLVSDRATRRWAPRAATGHSSLIDADGFFPTAALRETVVARALLDDVEREIRSQLAVALDTGLAPTHVDWHCLADGGRDDITELTIATACEYGLAARLWLAPGRRRARHRGLPTVDHEFLDSFALDVEGRTEQYLARLRGVPAGLTEWAVHPGRRDPAAQDDDRDEQVRRGDLLFLTSPEAADALATEGVRVTDYRGLRDHWVRAARRRT